MEDCQNYVRIDGGPVSLLALRSKHFNPQAWFGEDASLWLSKPFNLTRHGNYADARFNTAAPPIAFYKKLVSRFPDIRITYEYFGGNIVGHGYIDSTSARPCDYTPKSPSELAAIKGSRVWKLHLGEGEDLKQLILAECKYDDDGDCIMLCV
jgi:hypothetical protein